MRDSDWLKIKLVFDFSDLRSNTNFMQRGDWWRIQFYANIYANIFYFSDLRSNTNFMQWGDWWRIQFYANIFYANILC